jgi:hypothetical protein
MRIELISEDIYSFAEVISEYETSVLTVKLRGRTLIEWDGWGCQLTYPLSKIPSRVMTVSRTPTNIVSSLKEYAIYPDSQASNARETRCKVLL